MFQHEFSNFLDSHLMWSLGIPLKVEVSIKGLEGGGFLCAISNFWFFQHVGLVRRCWESDLDDC